MSGVEIVGVIAAIAQFVDLGAKVALGLSSFVSSLKNVPTRIDSATTNLRLFVDLASGLQAELQRLSPSNNGTQNHAQIKNVFDACRIEVSELMRIIDVVRSMGSDNNFQRAWKTIVGVKLERDILERCERLEHNKSNVMVLLEGQNLILGVQQS